MPNQEQKKHPAAAEAGASQVVNDPKVMSASPSMSEELLVGTNARQDLELAERMLREEVKIDDVTARRNLVRLIFSHPQMSDREKQDAVQFQYKPSAALAAVAANGAQQHATVVLPNKAPT